MKELKKAKGGRKLGQTNEGRYKGREIRMLAGRKIQRLTVD